MQRGGGETERKTETEGQRQRERQTQRQRPIESTKWSMIPNTLHTVTLHHYSACSRYTEVSDGKGGKIRVKKPKASKGGKGGKGGKEKKWYDDVPEFSDATTDSDAVDLDAMDPEERERYLAERAKRREEREKRRRGKIRRQIRRDVCRPRSVGCSLVFVCNTGAVLTNPAD